MADAVYVVVPTSQGNRRLQVKRTNIALTSDTAVEIVAAVTGKAIRVLALMMTASDNETFDFNDGSTYLYGSASVEGKFGNDGLVGGYQINLPFDPNGHFKTGAGNALNFTASSLSDIAGCLSYCEV